MNSVNILGRLVKSPEVKYAGTNNVPVCSFTVAVNRIKKGEADFISCKAFNQTAEFIGKYFDKGAQIALEGRIQTGSYEKDGTKIYTTDVIVSKAHFAGAKKESSDSSETAAPKTEQQEGFSVDGKFYPVDPTASEDDELPF